MHSPVVDPVTEEDTLMSQDENIANIEAAGHIDADEDDAMSDYGSSMKRFFSESDLTSITSSIINYVYENGRRYHANLVLPNDETEQKRLDLSHEVSRLLIHGRLNLSPLGPGVQKVLDIGTGTGIWALDFAVKHPSAQVIGTDLCPIQPEWTIPNCSFEVDDCEEEWVYAEEYFDFIHARNLMQSIKDWPRLIERMYKHVKPGGWVEIVDIDHLWSSQNDSIKPDSAVRLAEQLITDAYPRVGLEILGCKGLEAYVRAQGFEEVRVYQMKMPFAGWPRDPRLKSIGEYNALMAAPSLEAYGLGLLCRGANMDPGYIRRLIADVTKEITDKKKQTYHYIYHIIGRRPFTEY